MKKLLSNPSGQGRKNRVNVSLSTPYENKLKKLAIACGGQPPTTLACVLICFCLDNPKIIDYVQQEFQVTDDYRVVPIRENGITKYMVLR